MNKNKRKKQITITLLLSIAFLMAGLLTKHIGTHNTRIPRLLFAMGTFNMGIACYKWADCEEG